MNAQDSLIVGVNGKEVGIEVGTEINIENSKAAFEEDVLRLTINTKDSNAKD